MKLFIKYMVSIRCKMLVKSELEKLGLQFTTVESGEVNIKEGISEAQLKVLKIVLKKAGLELMDDRKSILIEKIKTVIIEQVHYSDEALRVNFSNFLAAKLNHDYTYLANLFSEVQGITIEHYIINHKIERVKELILYDELNLTEIAHKLQYSSVAHLSSQFKKVTGLTPSHFRKLRRKKLKAIDKL